MKIETKFKEGDKIFFISDAKKVVSTTVQGFIIERLPKKDEMRTSIIYLCNSEAGSNVNLRVNEEMAFVSKDELIQSL